jgi:hypothetical protein
MRHRPCTVCLVTLVAAAGFALPVFGQTEGTPPPPIRTTGNASRDTLVRLTRPATVDFQDKRLEDVITYIQTSTAAEIEPLWADDRNTEGLDKEKLITVKVDNGSFLSLIEKVMERAKGDTGGDNTWQMSETGALQLGPKERLNKFRRVEIYDINDLLMEVPDYTEVPRIDLQQALQSNQGGGGGQSPFRDSGGDNQRNAKLKDRQTKTDEVIQLIQSIVEPDQWVDNGGSGGSIKVFQGALIVNAPDYMQRGIDGYKYWPSNATRSAMVEGRRYVTLTGDAGLAKVLGFGQQEVSAVAGGQLFRSGPPGGGGSIARPPANPGSGPKR